MADSMNDTSSFNPFDPAEPARDAELGALLRHAAGDVPVGSVNWDALASRISQSLPGRVVTPWWGYAARWERRMLPIALAASLLGAFALWSASDSPAVSVVQVSSSDVVAELAEGVPVSDAATSFARAVTAEADYGLLVSE